MEPLVVSVPQFRLVKPHQLRLTELDRAELLARLMRAQTDLLILANDPRLGVDDRDRLRLAASAAGEVRVMS